MRTKTIGYLRDIRRWVVALSRARLGLYVLGRRRLFESCAEVAQTWSKLIANGDQLKLVSGEMWPTKRKVSLTLILLLIGGGPGGCCKRHRRSRAYGPVYLCNDRKGFGQEWTPKGLNSVLKRFG